MIWETTERVNRLRQQALSDPKFVQSAKDHEEAIRHQESNDYKRKRLSGKGKERAFADIYSSLECETEPNEQHH